jgi:HSP20 family protein
MVSTRFQPWNEVWSEMNRLQGEMNRLFGRLGNGNTSRSSVGFPALNLWEEQDSLFVEAELPGMELSDIEIYVNAGNVLTIKGERRPPQPDQGTWHRQERGYGMFHRMFELPAPVDADRVMAHFKHGILRIELPKCEEAKPRRIEVKAD